MGNGGSSSKKESVPVKTSFQRGTIQPAPLPTQPVRHKLSVVPSFNYNNLHKIAEPPKPINYISNVETPHSYKLWSESYLKGRIKSDDLETLRSRIDTKSNEIQKKNEQNAHEARMKRLNVTERFGFFIKQSKPALTINSCLPIEDKLKAYKANDEKYFPPASKRPELTPQMLNEVQNATRPNPSNELLAKIDGAEILRKDIQTLVGLNWLNDEIVNAYMNLLVVRSQKFGYKKTYAFNTFFFPKVRDIGYSSVKRWTRKVDIFSYDFVIVPVHLGNHWCLAFIDLTQRIISYYDSLGGSPNGCCDILLDYLRDESKDKKKQDFDDENWRLVNRYPEGIPQQKNCSDCGVFVCIYAEYLTRQAKLDFSQEHMPYFRKKMIYEIINTRILE